MAVPEMNRKMPRGAIPSPRSDLAATQSYMPGADAGVSIPSGAFPSPNQELAAAQPYRDRSSVPEMFLAWPVALRDWSADSMWAEEAFAKACAEPRVALPAEVVLEAARACGTSNFAAFLQNRGFEMEGNAYLSGPFEALNWMDAALLQGAIAHAGPVKIGISREVLMAGLKGSATAGASGWLVHGLHAGGPGDACASVFGYGQMHELVTAFGEHGVRVAVPPDVPAGTYYAMFAMGSMGIVDGPSLMRCVTEAWVRVPVTIVREL